MRKNAKQRSNNTKRRTEQKLSFDSLIGPTKNEPFKIRLPPNNVKQSAVNGIIKKEKKQSLSQNANSNKSRLKSCWEREKKSAPIWWQHKCKDIEMSLGVSEKEERLQRTLSRRACESRMGDYSNGKSSLIGSCIGSDRQPVEEFLPEVLRLKSATGMKLYQPCLRGLEIELQQVDVVARKWTLNRKTFSFRLARS